MRFRKAFEAAAFPSVDESEVPDAPFLEVRHLPRGEFAATAIVMDTRGRKHSSTTVFATTARGGVVRGGEVDIQAILPKETLAIGA